MDYLEYCLQQYFYATHWRPDLQYGSLLRDARAVLDFAIPCHSGLSLSVAKPISSTATSASTSASGGSLLHSRHSVGLGAPSSAPSSGSIGFLFTSVPLDTPSSKDDDPLARSVADKLSAVGVKVVDDLASSPASSNGSFLMYGRLFRSANLEYVMARRLSHRTLLSMSGMSTWHPGGSFVHYNLATNREKWGHEVCFSSENALFGFRWLRAMSPSVSLGGELYYLANEVSGGMSLGLKHSSPLSTTTLTLNPLLGHVSSSYTSWVAPGLRTACRYDYNVYSYESDLSVGFVFSPNHTNVREPWTPECDRSGTLIKVRYGIARGLALVYQQTWDKLGVKIGLAVQSFGRNASIGGGAGVGGGMGGATLGVDLSYSL